MASPQDESPSADVLLRSPVLRVEPLRELLKDVGSPAPPGDTDLDRGLRSLRRLRDRQGWPAGASARSPGERRGSRFRLVLTPPELGELRLDLVIRGKRLQVTLQAERPSAAEAVRARWAELKEALERQGFEVGDLAVAAEGGDDAGREEGASPYPQVVDLDV